MSRLMFDCLRVYAFACIFASFTLFNVIFWMAAFHPTARLIIDVNAIGERELETFLIGISYVCIVSWVLLSYLFARYSKHTWRNMSATSNRLAEIQKA